MHVARVIGLATLCVVALCPAVALAQGAAEPRPLLVGVMDVPPFSMKGADGRWEGLSIALWERVAESLGREYELREYRDLGSLLAAVEAGDVDVTPAAAASAPREVTMDLSHSYYQSGSGIAVAASQTGTGWLEVAGHLVSLDLLRVIGLLFLVWVLAGAMVWLFERGRNHEMFGRGTLRGLGNGVWWAAVTMTTVGYGDKAPKTLGGRTVAIAWMLASVMLVSSFTAAITTSLTLDRLSGNVRGLRDLADVRVGTVAESQTVRFLDERGIAAQPYADEREGLRAIVDGEIDAFVFNELALRYIARSEFPSQLRVLPNVFDHYHVKMAVQTGSALREPLNRTLLEILDAGDWRRSAERYLGSEP
jgi:polar amino acid transport system substrate-binding protein